MDVNESRKNLRNIIKKNLKKEEPLETQNNFKKGTNLENETEKIQQLIHVRQNSWLTQKHQAQQKKKLGKVNTSLLISSYNSS